MSRSDRADVVRCRVVLIDFDWSDADLLPGLLRAPGTSIGLVAGRGADDPGVRAAALCGLPATQDLSDLTREIFDVALVGERSPRREVIERLLRLLGTRVDSARGFALPPNGTPADDSGAVAVEAPVVAPAPAGAARDARPAAPTLLAPEAFSARLGVAVDRYLADGSPFDLHRIAFSGPGAALEGFVTRLPQLLGAADAACRPAPRDVLLLHTGTTEAFDLLRRRIESQWAERWAERGGGGSVPAIAVERIELDLPARGEARP